MSRNPNSNPLWLTVRLPHIYWQALDLQCNPNAAIVVTEKQKVVWANAKALSEGVTRGMPTTTAESLSACETHSRHPKAEIASIKKLSERCYAFTPYIQEQHSPAFFQSGLLLEISSCLKLFGNAQALAQQIKQTINAAGFTTQLGLAHSACAAWLLSFFVKPDFNHGDKSIFIEQLKQLPIACLRDFPKEMDALEKMGFETLGDIAKQIEHQGISTIKKRFSENFIDMLEDIFAIDTNFQQASLFTKPVAYYHPDEFFEEFIQFDFPIHNSELLEKPLHTLLNKLSQYLRKRQLATHSIEWVLSDIYHQQELIKIYADQSQTETTLLFDLTLIQLENRELKFEVDCVRLLCKETHAANPQSLSLDLGQRKSLGNAFALTAAKLKARLGDASVYKLSYVDEHFPEDTNQKIALSETSQQQLPDCHNNALRPTWLLEKPVAIEKHNNDLFWRGHIRLLVGPERIQGQWWKKPTARDYFLAQRQDAVRLWIFHDLHNDQWYVQGIFG